MTAQPTSSDVLDCVRSGTQLARLTPRPLRYAVPGIVPEGFVVLAGAPKRGKSWLTLDICLAIADGGTALGSVAVAPGRALYLALEDSERRLQARARHLLGGEHIPEAFDYLTNLAEPGRLLELVSNYCEERGDVRLVAIDTLARVRHRSHGTAAHTTGTTRLVPRSSASRTSTGLR